jgi:hypothetical protein
MADLNTKLDVAAAPEPAAINPIKTEAPADPPDPFDLSNLRLSQAFIETAGAKKLLITVPVRKPSPQDWVRVHASSISLANERAELAREQRHGLLIRNAAMRGDLISVDAVTRAGQRVMSVVRERILSVPGKKADALSMRTRDEVELILRDELCEALDELSQLGRLAPEAAE